MHYLKGIGVNLLPSIAVVLGQKLNLILSFMPQLSDMPLYSSLWAKHKARHSEDAVINKHDLALELLTIR